MSEKKEKKAEEKLSQVIRVTADRSLDIDAEVIRLSRIARRPYYRWEVVELMWEAYLKATRIVYGKTTVIDDALTPTHQIIIRNEDAQPATSAHSIDAPENPISKEVDEPGISLKGGADHSAARSSARRISQEVADMLAPTIAELQEGLQILRRDLERIYSERTHMPVPSRKRPDGDQQPAKRPPKAPAVAAKTKKHHTKGVDGGGGGPVNHLSLPPVWQRLEAEE